MDIFYKQPVDILDYDVDYGQWLPDGDQVTSANATVDIVGELQVDAIQIPVDGLTVKVWLSGGLANGRYKVTCTAMTQGGRTKEKEFLLRVKET